MLLSVFQGLKEKQTTFQESATQPSSSALPCLWGGCPEGKTHIPAAAQSQSTCCVTTTPCQRGRSKSSYLSSARRNLKRALSRSSPFSKEADSEEPANSLLSRHLPSHSAELSSQDSSPVMNSGWQMGMHHDLEIEALWLFSQQQ